MASTNDTTELPPGTSATGIENVTRLVEVHKSALNDITYTVEAEWDQVSGASDPRAAGAETTTITINSTNGPSRSLTRLSTDDVLNEFWSAENAFAAKTSVGSPSQAISYRYASGESTDPGFRRSVTALLGDRLNSSTYAYTGTVTTANRTLHEFWATGLRANTTPIASTHGRVLVDRSGRIHDATVVQRYGSGSDRRIVRLNYALRTGVVAPTRPDWVRAELPQLTGSVVGNGTVLALEHTGGLRVSNATIRTFFPDGRDIDVSVEDFEPGETLYLYRLRTAPDRVRVRVNEAPAVNDSFVPVGDDSVGVSAFTRPASFYGENLPLLIEVEPGGYG
ncbi:hypothetical protein [Halorussus marinus]|uniref:hypothetical protein n=1 Tax=Halorussus marinus TaxID=2505976 RepID=UPI001092CD7F|nr:hypothetical protein [Halorussus marinus]